MGGEAGEVLLGPVPMSALHPRGETERVVESKVSAPNTVRYNSNEASQTRSSSILPLLLSSATAIAGDGKVLPLIRRQCRPRGFPPGAATPVIEPLKAEWWSGRRPRRSIRAPTEAASMRRHAAGIGQSLGARTLYLYQNGAYTLLHDIQHFDHAPGARSAKERVE